MPAAALKLLWSQTTARSCAIRTSGALLLALALAASAVPVPGVSACSQAANSSTSAASAPCTPKARLAARLAANLAARLAASRARCCFCSSEPRQGFFSAPPGWPGLVPVPEAGWAGGDGGVFPRLVLRGLCRHG